MSPIDFGIKGSDSKHLRLYDCGITELRCRSCSLRGTLPIGLSQLTRLVLLDLGSNALSGTIDAASLSGLGALRILILHNNNLEGHLPPSLFNPTPLLETIDLNSNNIHGALQPELFESLAHLKDLRLYLCH